MDHLEYWKSEICQGKPKQDSDGKWYDSKNNSYYDRENNYGLSKELIHHST